MDKKICPAPECDNIVHSSKSKYCSSACKQRAYRYNKSNGVVSGTSGRRRRRSSVHTGDITTDLSMAAIDNVMVNAIGGRSMTNGITSDLLRVGIPYISDCCKKRPLQTLLTFGIGVVLSPFILRQCTVTTKGKTSTKVCSKPSGIQRVASGAVLALGTNFLRDNFLKVEEYASSVTVALRNGDVTRPVTTPIKARNIEFTTAN